METTHSKSSIPCISVIVPVYNAEKYISECIYSILKQTYRNICIILIDDGSTDTSGEICDRYATENKNIITLHQPNGGASAARAKGVEIADKKGYITFVDADDTITPNALETLYKASEGSDIVLGRIRSWRKMSTSFPAGIYPLEAYRLACTVGRGIIVGPVAHLYKATLFDKHTFDIPRSIVKGEDMIMNVRLAYANEKPVRLIDTEIYIYRQNPESITHKVALSSSTEELFLTTLLSSEKLLEDSVCVREATAAFLPNIYNIIHELYKDPSKSKISILLKGNKSELTWLQRTVLFSKSREIATLAMIAYRIYRRLKNIYRREK